MTLEYLIEGAVILGTTKGQHLVTVALIPPGSRAFEPDMTDEFVRRLNPTAPQRIAASAKLTIVRPISMVVKIVPTIGDRFERLIRRGLHTFQATKHPPHFAHIEPSQGRFDPFKSLLR
jgi:hypothetical protein